MKRVAPQSSPSAGLFDSHGVQHSLPIDSWKEYQLRLSQTERLGQDQDEQERNTQQGSPELYWRSRLNQIRRQKALVTLSIKESVCLGNAARSVGLQLENLVPGHFQACLKGPLGTEVESQKEWAAVSEQNLRLLSKLEHAEEAHSKSQQAYAATVIMEENIAAAGSLIELESAIFLGQCSHWPVHLDSVLTKGWTALGLLKIQKETHRLEAKIAELSGDLEELVYLLNEIEDLSLTLPAVGKASSFETPWNQQAAKKMNVLIRQGYALAAKHVPNAGLQHPDPPVS